MRPVQPNRDFDGVRLALRVDATAEIGAGHIMRCLVLADLLAARGARSVFISHALPAALESRVRDSGHDVVLLPDSPGDALDATATHAAIEQLGSLDWLVVDHYGLGVDWERAMRDACAGLLAIDDLHRTHDIDILLDQNALDPMAYADVVPETCVRLLGPTSALMRAEFIEQRALLAERDGTARRVLVSMGGGDATQPTLAVVRALTRVLPHDMAAVVIVTSACSDIDDLERQVTTAGYTLHVDSDRVAALVAGADLAIGAGGTGAWERAFLGVPGLLVCTADNQRGVIDALVGAGAATFVSDGVDEGALERELSGLLHDPARLAAMSRAATALMGTPGPERFEPLLVALRGAWAIAEPGLRLRRMRPSDRYRLLQWRMSDRVRPYMDDQTPITPEMHAEWFARVLQDPDRHYLICESLGEPVGMVHFDRESGDRFEWGFYVGEASAPTGTGARMCALGLRHAFADLGAAVVTSHVRIDNPRSIALHEQLGFHVVGPNTEAEFRLELRSDDRVETGGGS